MDSNCEGVANPRWQQSFGWSGISEYQQGHPVIPSLSPLLSDAKGKAVKEEAGKLSFTMPGHSTFNRCSYGLG